MARKNRKTATDTFLAAANTRKATPAIPPVKRRRRRTVAAPIAAPATPVNGPLFTMEQVRELFQTFTQTGQTTLVQREDRRQAPTESAVPQTAAPTPAPQVRPRIFYAFNPTPPVPGGEAGAKVLDWLKAHPGQQSQQDMEKGTLLTEGQIKGAIRTLYLAGWVTKHGNGGE